VLGTGPGLAPLIPAIRALRAAGRCRLFGINCTFRDFDSLDVFTACDPKWWDHYGADVLAYLEYHTTEAWHWDRAVCDKWGPQFIEGRWKDGLSTNPEFIHYGHSSGYQVLNLALHYGCSPLILVGYDMTYRDGAPRHYFGDLSDLPGEYPPALRKFSTLDGLRKCYETIAAQPGLPPIYNATPGSALTCFPIKKLKELL
jgi:hypothetical protein